MRTPLTDNDVLRLKVGDIAYLSGVLVTARDATHRRIAELVERGLQIPIDLKGLAIYHAGPVVAKRGEEWIVISVGPTTSSRVDPYTPLIVESLGVKAIIGKGGIGVLAKDALKRTKAVYLEFIGGAGVLAASCVRRVIAVHWLDLGVPEALWVLEVERFGPLIVTIDAYGNDLREEVRKRAFERARGSMDALTQAIMNVMESATDPSIIDQSPLKYHHDLRSPLNHTNA